LKPRGGIITALGKLDDAPIAMQAAVDDADDLLAEAGLVVSGKPTESITLTRKLSQ